jgi:membrane protein required for colicin V production
MMLDIFFLALVVLLTLLGLVSGFLAQTVRIVALVAACFLAPALSPRVEQLLSHWMQVNNLLGSLLSLVLAWLASYIVLALAGRILVRILRGSSGGIRFVDRVLGGILGGAKGALVAYLAACVLLTLREPMEKTDLVKFLDLNSSRVVATVSEYNVLWMTSLPDVSRLSEMVANLHDPEKKDKLLHDPRINGLRDNSAFQRLLQDAEFQKAAAEKKFDQLLRNQSFSQALKDVQIREFLAKWIPRGDSAKSGQGSPQP